MADVVARLFPYNGRYESPIATWTQSASDAVVGHGHRRCRGDGGRAAALRLSGLGRQAELSGLVSIAVGLERGWCRDPGDLLSFQAPPLTLDPGEFWGSAGRHGAGSNCAMTGSDRPPHAVAGLQTEPPQSKIVNPKSKKPAVAGPCPERITEPPQALRGASRPCHQEPER